MRQIVRTIKIDVTQQLSSDNVQSIRKTCSDYAIAYGIFTREICANKTANYNNVYGLAYKSVKKSVPDLPTAIVSSCGRNACANVKAFNSNITNINNSRRKHNKRCMRKHMDHDNSKYVKPTLSKWEFEGKHSGNSYKLNTCGISIVNNDSMISFASNDMRIKIPFKLPKWFVQRYPEHKLYSGQISIDKFDNILLYVTYAVGSNMQSKDIDNSTVIGIDRGIYHPVATSDGFLYSSKKDYAITRKYAHDVSTLKQKRSSSARKRLRSIAGKIRRHNNDVNHCLSKFLANKSDVSCYVLEDLTNISQNRKKGGNRWNRIIHSWSFRDFENKLMYKCEFNGICIKYVNPVNTSKRCSICGNIDSDSRNHNWYRCSVCGHIEHADINAAKNIRYKYLANQSSYAQGVYSITHDVPE